jgi:hypothetical protein
MLQECSLRKQGNKRALNGEQQDRPVRSGGRAAVWSGSDRKSPKKAAVGGVFPTSSRQSGPRRTMRKVREGRGICGRSFGSIAADGRVG